MFSFPTVRNVRLGSCRKPLSLMECCTFSGLAVSCRRIGGYWVHAGLGSLVNVKLCPSHCFTLFYPALQGRFCFSLCLHPKCSSKDFRWVYWGWSVQLRGEAVVAPRDSRCVCIEEGFHEIQTAVWLYAAMQAYFRTNLLGTWLVTNEWIFFYVCSIYCASHQFWYFIIAGYRRLLRWISCRRHGRRERSIDIQILGYIVDSFCSFPGNFQDLSWWESNLLWSSWDLGSLRSGRFSSLGFAARSCAGHFAFRSPGPGTTSSAWRCFAGWIAPARGWWFATSGGSCARGIAEVGHSQNSGFTREQRFQVRSSPQDNPKTRRHQTLSSMTSYWATFPMTWVGSSAPMWANSLMSLIPYPPRLTLMLLMPQVRSIARVGRLGMGNLFVCLTSCADVALQQLPWTKAAAGQGSSALYMVALGQCSHAWHWGMALCATFHTATLQPEAVL